VIAFCLVLALGEPALIGNVELAAGGGRDSNMFLSVTPGAAVVGGWFGRVAPRLLGALALDGFRLETSYALDYRGSDAGGRLVGQRLELGLILAPWSRLKASLTASAGRFDASAGGPDRFLFAGPELALRLELTPSWRAAGSYELDVRRFPDRATTDLLHLAELRLDYRSERLWGVEPIRATALADGVATLLRAGPAADLVFGRLSLSAWGWAGTLALPGHAGILQAGGGAGAIVRLATYLDLAATADWTASPGATDLAAATYDRRYVGLGVIAHAGSRLILTRRTEEADLAPMVRQGRVRFRWRAPATVIGSWDEWQTPGVTLGAADGVWEAWVALPSGSHRYRFLVDGRPVRPPDATRYMPDDFGGEDAVVEVPE
jgi:hypothetical protein